MGKGCCGRRHCFADGKLKRFCDVEAVVGVAQGFVRVALAVTFRAGDVEVGKELHLNLFKAITEATLAATGAGVKGEVARGKLVLQGFRAEGVELANGLEGSGVDRGSGPWSACQG